jgi:hypothetical protein
MALFLNSVALRAATSDVEGIASEHAAVVDYNGQQTAEHFSMASCRVEADVIRYIYVK